MKHEWVVVANASHARIFRQSGADGGLDLVEAMTHEQSRMHGSELTAGGDQGGGTRDHHDDRFEARNDLRRKEHLHFARALADRLDKGLAAKEFDSLTVLVAKPFLGELRQQLSEGVSEKIDVTLNNDLTALSVAEITQRLQLVRAAARGEIRGAT